MFCEECGTKNAKGVAFCENCGHKLVEEKKKTKKESNTVSKAESKNNKNVAIIVIVAIAALVGAYMYIASTLTPEKVALKYFKGLAKRDANAVYSTINLEESKFVNKKLLKESLKNEEKINLDNYKTSKADKKGISTIVTITYIEKGSSTEKTKTIKLSKSKAKKWLIFDNWTVDASDLMVSDFRLTIPKDTKPSVDGIKLPEKYKDDTYSSSYDVYVIPSILKGIHKLTVKYSSGLVLAADVKTTSRYSTYNLTLEDSINKKISKDIKSKLTTLYEAAMDEKDFDDIKDKFDEDSRENIESVYNNLKDYVNKDYNNLQEFKIKNVKIKSVNPQSDEVTLYVEIKYDYKVEYKLGDETKDYSKKDKTTTIYAVYDLNKKDYKMTNLRSLVTYFSHYGL